MRRVIKRLGFGALGAVIFLVVWLGIATIAHYAHFPAGLTDIVLAIAGLTTYASYVRIAERRNVDELNPRFAISQAGAGFAAGIGLFSLVITVLALRFLAPWQLRSRPTCCLP